MEKPIRYKVTMTVTVERRPDHDDPADWKWESLLYGVIVPHTPIIVDDVCELGEAE